MKQSKKETLKLADTTVKPNSENKPKDNEASCSKGKEKLTDDSEEDELDDHEMKQRKAREAQINEYNRIVGKSEEKEKA